MIFDGYVRERERERERGTEAHRDGEGFLSPFPSLSGGGERKMQKDFGRESEKINVSVLRIQSHECNWRPFLPPSLYA